MTEPAQAPQRRRTTPGQVILLGLLLVVAAAVGLRSWSRVQDIQRSASVCSAMDQDDPEQAVSLSDALIAAMPASDASSRALDCRCAALGRLGRERQCLDEVLDLLREPPAESWIPSEPLLLAGLGTLVDQGDPRQAAQIAARAQSALAGSDQDELRDTVAGLEFVARLRYQPADLVLEEYRDTVSSGPRRPGLELAIARSVQQRGNFEQALALLGTEPPAEREWADAWYEQRIQLAARKGDVDLLQEILLRWRQDGLSAADAQARYGYLLSAWGLAPFEEQEQQLRAAVAAEDEHGNPGLGLIVRDRLVGLLSKAGRFEGALELLEETEVIHGPGTVRATDRVELRRQISARDVTGGVGPADGPATLVVRGLQRGDALMVPAAVTLAAEAMDQHAALRDLVRVRPDDAGEARVQLPTGERPVWWVVRDSDERVVGSGTDWLQQGVETVRLLERHEPRSVAQRSDPLISRPGDGRRRVLGLVLDCGDWRILRHLNAAGRLPNLKALVDGGTSGVLYSDPPFTAAALRQLTQPAQQSLDVLQLAFQLGEEVEALNFVGRNPVQGLGQLLPRGQDLFEVFGSGSVRALNLLKAVGSIEAGRNGEVHGPDGARELQSGLVGERRLPETELAAVPGLSGDMESYGRLIKQIAGDLDSVLQSLDDTSIDFVFARVASLDMLTHGAFKEFAATGQHDGDLALLRGYRYIDLRLEEVFQRLDEDDALVVLSDHGIRTSLEHDEASLFVGYGPMFEAGRVLGPDAARIELKGASRLFADLLDVDVSWPYVGADQLLTP